MKHMILALCLCLSAHPVFSAHLNRNLTPEEIAQCKSYYHSGKYFKDIEHKTNEAKAYLERQRLERKQKKLALILEIDDVALSQYQNWERLNFTHNTQALTVAKMLGNATAIAPVHALYQYALDHHIAVFFISQRPNTPEIMLSTANNLKNAGYLLWDELILQPIEKQQSVQEFKTQARQKIALEYDILLNIGTQEADVQGGFAEVRIKLPTVQTAVERMSAPTLSAFY
jgi:predicted secreted acid phosphatase